MRILLQKERLLLQIQTMMHMTKNQHIKNNAPFFSCILKINNTLIESSEDLDIVMSMYNLLEYKKNYKKQQENFGIITEMNQIVV